MMPDPELRSRLLRGSPDERFLAWSDYFEKVLATQRYLSILKEWDSVLQAAAAQYLANVTTDSALQCLVILIQVANDNVGLAAERAFRKNTHTEKNTYLYPLLRPGVEKRAFLFAAEVLCECLERRALTLVLDRLPGHDEESILRLLGALGNFTDRLLVVPLRELLASTSERVGSRCLQIFARLHQAGFREAKRLLYHYAEHPLPVFRRLALWGLRRRAGSVEKKIFLKHFKEDPDLSVRCEAALGLRHFPEKKVLRTILQVLESNCPRLLSLRSESVLLSMMPKPFLAALAKFSFQKDADIYHRVLRLRAARGDFSRRFLKLIRTRLQNFTSPKEMVPWIDALGDVGEISDIPMLMDFFGQHALVSYAAVRAAVAITRRCHPETMVDLLLHAGLKDFEIAMILRSMVSFKKIKNQGKILVRLRELLLSPTFAVRYLALRVLVKTGIAGKGSLFLEAYNREVDPHFKNNLYQFIADEFSACPADMNELILQKKGSPAHIPLLLSLARRVRLSGEAAKIIWDEASDMKDLSDIDAADLAHVLMCFIFSPSSLLVAIKKSRLAKKIFLCLPSHPLFSRITTYEWSDNDIVELASQIQNFSFAEKTIFLQAISPSVALNVLIALTRSSDKNIEKENMEIFSQILRRAS